MKRFRHFAKKPVKFFSHLNTLGKDRGRGEECVLKEEI